MRIVTLQPYLTDTVLSLGLEAQLAGCTHLCSVPEGANQVVKVTTPSAAAGATLSADESRLASELTSWPVDLDALYAVKPDLIVTQCKASDRVAFTTWAEEALSKVMGRKVRVYCAQVKTLQGMYDTFEEVAVCAGQGRAGRELAHRVKSQLLDWGDNFYERLKNKRVTVLSSLKPLSLASSWIPSVIELASALPQMIVPGEEDRVTTWREVVEFKPDVIVVAPRGASLEESVRALKALERVPEWESIPAVKRGEVIFCDGLRLYSPGPKFLQGAGILFSAIAGLESGYITKRDEFYRLRFLELHRHRFL
jgi:iron complex transport system substrate-binding protein